MPRVLIQRAAVGHRGGTSFHVPSAVGHQPACAVTAEGSLSSPSSSFSSPSSRRGGCRWPDVGARPLGTLGPSLLTCPAFCREEEGWDTALPCTGNHLVSSLMGLLVSSLASAAPLFFSGLPSFPPHPLGLW